MNTKIALLIGGIVASVIASPAMAGGGVLDGFDPCIEQRDNFHEARVSLLRELDKSVADSDSAVVTPKYREAWMNAKRKQMRSTFDNLVAPALQEAGVTDMEGRFQIWLDKRLKAIGSDNLEKLIEVNFHQELKEVRIQERAAGNAQMQAEKDKLDKACKMDAGNQALRALITTALTPFEMVSKNLEIAKRESGVIAQGLAAGTGISVKAIQENGGVFGGGLSGGENSFFRKNLGIRF